MSACGVDDVRGREVRKRLVHDLRCTERERRPQCDTPLQLVACDTNIQLVRGPHE
jgi:hypothetical protein